MDDSLFSTDELSIEEYARERSAVFETEKNIGGCVLAVTGLAISSLHMLKDQTRFFIDGRVARVVHTNKSRDLVAFAVETKALSWIHISASPKIGDEIVFLAPRYGRKKPGRKKQILLLPCQGKVTFADDDVVCGNMSTAFGVCGMGVFGAGLIGIVDSDDKFEYLLAIPGRIVRRFAGKAYRKLHQKEALPPPRPSWLPILWQGRLLW